VNLRRKQQELPELNLIPLIDIVFMLLIFFIVTTTFNRETEMSVNLPVASADPLVTGHKQLEISIDASGHFFVNRVAVRDMDIESLKRTLQKAAAGLKDPSLIISADGKTPHQAVIMAMDAARQLGLVHLTFATVPQGDSR